VAGVVVVVMTIVDLIYMDVGGGQPLSPHRAVWGSCDGHARADGCLFEGLGRREGVRAPGQSKGVPCLQGKTCEGIAKAI
jgi:hypothetical protein